MALTKITGQVINTATDVTVGVLTVTNTLSVGGTVSVGGTLTYEDVTNVDSVGIITARSNILVGSGITLSPDGNVFATGISTVKGIHINGTQLGEDLKVGTGVTITRDGDIFATGVTTTTHTIVNTTTNNKGLIINATGNDHYASLTGNAARTGADEFLLNIRGQWNDTTVSNIILETGSDTTNKDNGVIAFRTASAGSPEERLRIASGGQLLIGDTTARGTDGGNTPLLQVASNTSGVWARMLSATYINSTIGGGIILAHSRNGTIGSHTVLQNNDKLGSIFFEGSDGTEFARGAQIQAFVDGTPGTDDMPGRIEFSTTADGSSSPTVRATFDSSGSFIVGNTSSGIAVGSGSAAKLQVKHTSGNISAAFYSTANASGPAGILALGHARDTVSGVLQEDDIMGEIRFAGGDGTDLESIGARIKAEVDATPGSNDMPGALVFGTTADGAAAPTDHLKLTRNGLLSFLNAGDGITFPNGHSVTPNDLEAVLSNTLDDFESGDLDWEIHKDNSLTTGTNASGSHAKYVKIGPVVHIFGWIRTDGQTSTNNRTAVMTDASGNRAQLPFTPLGIVMIPVNFTRAFQNSTTLNGICLGAAHANDDLYIHGNQSNQYSPASDNCALTNQTNLVIAFNGSYYTND